MDVTSKVAIITGGAMGLGKGFAGGLLQRGATVMLADLDAVQGNKTCEEFRDEFGQQRVSFAQCDVSKTEDLKKLFQKTKHLYSHVDIVINNAGVPETFGMRKVIDIDLIAVIEGTNLAVHYMKKENGGRGGLIVNIGSSAGLIPGRWPIYAAAKTGVVTLTRSLAGRVYDTTDQGIRVTCLCPSFVNTRPKQWDFARYHDTMKEGDIMPIKRVVEALMNMVDNPSNNGGIYVVTPDIMRYKYPYHLRGKL